MLRQKSLFQSLPWMAIILAAIALSIAGCDSPVPPPHKPSVVNPNLDGDTQALIAAAERVVFLIPFSHWDTDWHGTFADYAQRSDHNILAAIQIAKKYPRFRYTLEQTLFVQHFWDNYPSYREDLKTLVQKRQFTFAWAGITQPESSLVAPAIQVRNLQSGEDWIAATFGQAAVPVSAWQSDAFGNSAALPIFLTQSGIPYAFIGRGRNRCDPNDQNCQPLPLAFYWNSPVADPAGAGAAQVLVDYVSYSLAWGATYNVSGVEEQVKAFREAVDAQLKRTNSKYLLLPYGFDFLDPSEALLNLVDNWNAGESRVVLVIADPNTAFQYLATQDLPEITTDLNPIWQAFYASRPFAKIADKESEYFLTAMDKFGLLSDDQQTAMQSAVWELATVNAHYDNISGVGFDQVWESSQRPRFEEAIAMASDGLAEILAHIASGIFAREVSGTPLPAVTIFNPSSWPRSEILELRGELPDLSGLPLPVQYLAPNHVAIQVPAVPPVGYTTLTGQTAESRASPAAVHPAAISEVGDRVRLSNGLVSVELDPKHGGTFSSLSLQVGLSQPFEYLSANGDDVTYWNDSGDVYGARFGAVLAQESDVPAEISTLASGPLVARAQVNFILSGQAITKTVSVSAGSPIVDVTLQIAALPETTALVQTPTVLRTDTRTDDVGFAALEHSIDNRPIVPGDITYRREIFYPITYWSDVTSGDYGLTLITHGLQGLAGTDTLSLMLVRQVTDERDGEGVTDPEYHTLHYAYLPHTGGVLDAKPWTAAYAFNQPLIPVWPSGGHLNVQLPYRDNTQTHSFEINETAAQRPLSASLISAEDGMILDLIRREDKIEALAIDYDPGTPTTIQVDENRFNPPAAPLILVPIKLK
jgi:alpha-mannosidase